MNDQTTVQATNIVLSREELLLVLDALGTAFIPGLEPDPLGELTPDGRQLALTVARRALEARGLARADSAGALQLRRALLNAVGTCAYSQRAVIAFHWPSGATEAARLFGHVRGDDAVAHQRPAPALHAFTIQPDRAALVDQVLGFCECGEGAPGDAASFTVPGDVLAEARRLAAAGSAAEATSLLAGAGGPAEAANALAQTLAAAPRISALQTLRQTDGGADSREFSLIEDGRRAWWVATSGDGASVLISPTTADAVRTALAEWL